MRIVLIGLLMLVGSVSAGQIFRWVDAQGNVIYTDRPPEGVDAKGVELRPITTVRAFRAPESRAGTTAPSAAGVGYKRLAVASPAQDSTIRSNNGDVTVELDIEPELARERGHRVDLYLDGNVVSSGQTSVFGLKHLSRGTHEIEAAVLDGDGQVVIRSEVIRFHLLRRTVLLR